MSQGSGSKVRHGYEEVAKLDDPDGPRAVISRRVADPPLFTVAFFKWYRDSEDQVMQTAFFTRKSLAALRRMIDTAEQQMIKLEQDELELKHKRTASR